MNTSSIVTRQGHRMLQIGVSLFGFGSSAFRVGDFNSI
jgi:hypothetical protein